MITQYFFWILCIIIILNMLNWIRKLHMAKCYLELNQKNDDKNMNSDPIAIIIPVLEETTRIRNTINQMLSVINSMEYCYIILVTTEKEYQCHLNTNKKYIEHIKIAKSKYEVIELLDKLSLTIDLRKDHIDNLSLKSFKNNAVELINNRPTTIDLAKEISLNNQNVKVYHCNKVDGVMAHQVNVGIKSFIKENPQLKETVLFGLYNADSYINYNTIKWIQSKRKNAMGRSVIFQQYGNYVKNLDSIKKNNCISKFILLTSSMWQTRWSLGFEIANALCQFKKKGFQEEFFYVDHKMLNYCIGHGLYFDYKTFERFCGFSEITHNEDAIWGVQASYLMIPIIPVPILEISESPDAVYSLYKQKTTWFLGPMQAFKYYKNIKTMFKLKSFKEKASLLNLCCRLFEHAIRWIVVPIQMLLLFILYWNSFPKLIIALIISTTYLNIPNFIAIKITNRYTMPENRVHISLKDYLGMIIFAPLQFWLHGLSGLRAILRVIVCKVTNKKLEKERTPLKEMN